MNRTRIVARSVRRTIGSALLTVLSVLGVLCILGVLAAWIWGYSIVLFSTGSMAPTITAGSAAVVRQIPASEVRVGDVVTVARPNLLPVTHRVRSIELGPGEQRVLTLRGDANASDDAVPYRVVTVRRVLFSVPGIATFVHQLGDPFVLGAASLVMAVVVGWVFWPRDPSAAAHGPLQDDGPGDDADGPGREPGGSDEPDAGDASGGSDRSGSGSEPGSGDEAGSGYRPRAGEMPRTGEVTATDVRTAGDGWIAPPRIGTRAGGAAALVLLGVLTFSAVGTVAPAAAAVTEQVHSGRYLTLVAVGDEAAMHSLLPGVPVDWQVGVSIAAPERGTVTVSMLVGGDGGNIRLAVALCDERWVAGTCASGARSVLTGTPARSLAGSPIVLDTVPTDRRTWVRVRAELPAGVRPRDARGTATVRVRAQAFGDQVDSGGKPIGSLPNTGVPAGTVTGVAFVAIVVGALLLAVVGRRRSMTS